MRGVQADNVVESRHAGNCNSNSRAQRRAGVAMFEGPGMMITGKAAAWAGSAAVAGGLARFLARGDYKFQVLVQDIIGALFGWCLVVALTVVYPTILHDIWVFGAMVFLSAYIAPALLVAVFQRIETVEINVDVGGVEIHSNGKDKNK